MFKSTQTSTKNQQKTKKVVSTKRAVSTLGKKQVKRPLKAKKPFSSAASSSYNYTPLFQHPNKVETPWRKLTDKGVTETVLPDGSKFLNVSDEALTLLSETAMFDIAHLLRPGHLKQLAKILEDPEATDNDRFVAMELLRNANIASGMVLPSCQDTGTAIVMGKRGQRVLTSGNDEAALSQGVLNTYTKRNLRYSQVAPLDMFTEKNTGTNLPAQIDLYATNGDEYKFLFLAKGGGSANKTFLYQQTKALLNEKSLEAFIRTNIKSLGTSACPPYHLALVIGGLSAEQNLKTVKMASARYYDDLPTTGDATGRAFRDTVWEEKMNKIAQESGIGAQFGGKYFAHDVRVIRLPRHGASCPVGLGVSCSADRQVLGKINKDGVFIEQLETNPAQYMPAPTPDQLHAAEVVEIDLDKGMDYVRSVLTKYPVKTRFSLTGTIIVARDIAHAKLKERLDAGESLPDYFKEHIVYYAGPAKTPPANSLTVQQEEQLQKHLIDSAIGKTYASGSFGPTTAGRMDSYVDLFQQHGGSMVMLAKGNRSKQVTEACKKYGGFYLGSIGGPAAVLAEDCITDIAIQEYPELGMEAIWKVKVKNFPCFQVVDDKGNDFFSGLI
jgi:fumarate hydratase class I